MVVVSHNITSRYINPVMLSLKTCTWRFFILTVILSWSDGYDYLSIKIPHSFRLSHNYYQCLHIAHLLNQLVELNQHVKQLLSGSKTRTHLWKHLIGFLTYSSISHADIRVIEQMRSQMRFE